MEMYIASRITVNISRDCKTTPITEILFTGHSAGAAIAQIFYAMSMTAGSKMESSVKGLICVETCFNASVIWLLYRTAKDSLRHICSATDHQYTVLAEGYYGFSSTFRRNVLFSPQRRRPGRCGSTKSPRRIAGGVPRAGGSARSKAPGWVQSTSAIFPSAWKLHSDARTWSGWQWVRGGRLVLRWYEPCREGTVRRPVLASDGQIHARTSEHLETELDRPPVDYNNNAISHHVWSMTHILNKSINFWMATEEKKASCEGERWCGLKEDMWLQATSYGGKCSLKWWQVHPTLHQRERGADCIIVFVYCQDIAKPLAGGTYLHTSKTRFIVFTEIIRLSQLGISMRTSILWTFHKRSKSRTEPLFYLY